MSDADQLQRKHQLSVDICYHQTKAFDFVLSGQLTRATDIIKYMQGVDKQVKALIDKHNSETQP